jgi:hypothetical protein
MSNAEGDEQMKISVDLPNPVVDQQRIASALKSIGGFEFFSQEPPQRPSWQRQELTLKGPARLVLLNAPPGAGKDHMAQALLDSDFGDRVVVLKVAGAIKDLVHRERGFPGVAHDHFESMKDKPLAEFGGRSPRQCYIAKGEELRSKSKTAVLDLLQPQIDALAGTGKVGVITDIGYGFEVEHLAKLVDQQAVVVRIHRAGKTFARDCRQWVQTDSLPLVDLRNDGTPAFAERAVQTIKKFL